jgi:diacylglycerol O-acyltransferase / wax synthase
VDRMTPLDASFLFAEDGNSHMDIGMVLEIDGPAMSAEEVAEAIAGRLALVPRYRQKIRLVPAAAALPVWVDDVDFDVRRHVFETTAPTPGEDGLFAAVSRVMSSQFDRGKPLWEAHLVTGLGEDRWALVVRMHHAMVDGITSTAIVGELLTRSPEVPEPVDDGWSPAPEPSDW